jgi:hypothetical protein
MTATKTNGTDQQTRSTLAQQIDRLDRILDGLSDNLNAAVAEAVSKAVANTINQAVAQAVHEAVQAVLTEVLTNRQLQQRLHAVAQEAAAPPNPTPDDHTTSSKGPLARAWQATCDAVRQAGRSALAAGVLIGGAVAAGFFATRSWVYRAAATVWSWGTGLIYGAASALGNLLPTFAGCT